MSTSLNIRFLISVPRPCSSVSLSSGNNTTFSNNYLPSAFAVLSMDKSRDVWMGGSGASCHVTNDENKIYYVRPSPSDQRKVTTNDGIRQKVEYVGNIDVVFHGRSDEPITLCDVSYIPGLIFNISSFHKAQQTHVMILDACRKILLSRARRVGPTCKRADICPVLWEQNQERIEH